MPNILTRPVLRHMYNISVILHVCIYAYVPVYTYKIKSFWKWDYRKALQSLELKWKYWNTENNYSLCSALRVSDATVLPLSSGRSSDNLPIVNLREVLGNKPISSRPARGDVSGLVVGCAAHVHLKTELLQQPREWRCFDFGLFQCR